ncbi:outer membrane beta-barrel protein [Williamwhitmania taraxaci]|uniref:Outer membrane protein beta-barrel domain-containing protein n=1 Tax=Williamwhitmania taraxaci TaxID=1640674 RepID=A0A1G6HNM5_9BACT|nr:outer membrane beta-barrel protein [Williamwhitmania taraxaci]SDB95840.1 Outer membrane protein beta-barrel domain-containing protein [Williamwhitmania taraxaci]
MRVRHLFIIVLFLVAGTSAFGQQWKQSRFELLGGISICQLFGDIGGSASSNNLMGLKDLSFSALRPGIVVGTRSELNDRFSVKGLVSSTFMVANDAGSRNENRGFKANVFVTDFSVTGEYYITKSNDNRTFSVMAVRGGVRPYGTPFGIYIYAGVGGALLSSSGNSALKEHPNYVGGSSFTAIFPVGVGVKVNLRPRLSFNGEFGTRITLTDKLDAYTSQYSKSNDLYYALTLGVSYKIIVKKTDSKRWFF